MAIVGVGSTPAAPVTPHLSYKELTYEAAVRAYSDAGIEPEDVESFVCVSEDFHEGTSIFDEYVPDQLGAVQKPVHTISGDGLHGTISAALQILTGQFDLVVVEGHSKASNVLTPHHIANYALDPVFNRPLGVNPHYVAGLEMARYLELTGTSREECARVVVKNRAHALLNPSGCFGATLTVEDVLGSPPVAEPLVELEIAPHSDVAYVIVLASEDAARTLRGSPIWIDGMGWSNDSPTLETRDWNEAAYARDAARMAYAKAGVQNPYREIDFAEVDDTYSYKELLHLEALGLFRPGTAGGATADGLTSLGGEFPVNPSGGCLGMGRMHEASGLARLAEAMAQLRGEAGPRQVPDATRGLVMSWRGIPTTSGAVLVLSGDEGRGGGRWRASCPARSVPAVQRGRGPFPSPSQ
ncbi:MAG: acetyl-CoA acetyltransferase [Planctomycetes bacterium]|nr:acetyl-CoA acetyltransferase [Planctomycetota bacterium]